MGEWIALAQAFFADSQRGVVVMRVEADGPRIVHVNDAFHDLGLDRDVILGRGRDFWDLTVRGTEVPERIGEEPELGARRANAELHRIELFMTPLETPEGIFIVAIAMPAGLGTRTRRTEGDDRWRPLEPTFVVCSYCENVRDLEGPWTSLRTLVHTTDRFTVSHGICPVCFSRAQARHKDADR